MATCPYCATEMLEVDGCTDEPIVIDGQAYLPVRYGRERGRRGVRVRCPDCGVLPGSVHHHGCDMEQCPRCSRQSITCDCLWAGEEHLSDEWLEEMEERFANS